MRAFWDPTKAERVFREDATAVMARVYGLEAGAYAHSFEGAISPKTTRETPVGELIMWSSEGFVNDQGADLSRLLYYGERRAGQRQQQLLHDALRGHRRVEC